jgi:hypothetical protein
VEKQDFHEHVRYTLTVKDSDNKLRPMNVYILKLHDDNMIARMTDKEGILRKIKYEDVIKIVHEKAVPKQDHYIVPAALLLEKNWADRDEIQHYSNSPHMGK